jgi:glycosyltransferase involved in cell wall biosynthesis
MMKILMQNRRSLLTARAGETVQVEKTREALIRLGLRVHLSTAPAPDLCGYDLVHLFNIMAARETYQQLVNARRQRKPAVLSPIYWDPGEYLSATGQSSVYGSWWEETMPLRRAVLAGVAAILPNSRMELEELRRLFSILPPAQIVPNAAETLFAAARPEHFLRKYGCKNFLLSVGRICRRKNQLSLIRAARELNYPLVLIGPLNDGEYYCECRRAAAGTGTLFIDALPPEELATAYAAARVHALVSWYDTPGLVSLEAAAAGCRLVTTDRGSAREYLEDLVEYCDPGDIASIQRAVAAAWKRPTPDPKLRAKILQEYNWERAAQATLQGYRQALGKIVGSG